MSLLDYILQTEWAMCPDTLGRMLEIVDRHTSGQKLTAEQIEAATRRRPGTMPVPEMRVEDGVAIIPVHGVIARHASAVGDISSPRGTSAEQIRANLLAALADPDVGSILLDVDSPGGSVAGIADLADEIAAATKPVTAYASDLMASAAYWIASGADRIAAAQTARVGSIGVYAVMHDTSHRDHDAGIKRTVISSGRVKGGGAGGQVTGDQIQNTQAIVETLANIFLDSVEERRGLDQAQMDAIREGGVYVADQARRHGLVDEIASFGDVLAGCREEGERLRAEDVEVDISVTDMEAAPMTEQTPTPEDIRAADTERLMALRAALPADEALDAYLAGKTVAQAKADRYDALVADLAKEREESAKLKADLESSRNARMLGNEPVGQADPPAMQADPVARFNAIVDGYEQQTGDRLRATSMAVREHTTAYREYLAAVNGMDSVQWPPRQFARN
jgi:signal peptide peptidase SppA